MNTYRKKRRGVKFPVILLAIFLFTKMTLAELTLVNSQVLVEESIIRIVLSEAVTNQINLLGSIKIFDETNPNNNFFIIPTPWAEATINQPPDNEIIIPLLFPPGHAFKTWLESTNRARLDLAGGIFISVGSSEGNRAETNWPINVYQNAAAAQGGGGGPGPGNPPQGLHLVWGEFKPNENILHLEFNDPVVDSLTQKSNAITLKTPASPTGFQLGTPWQETSPVINDNEIWVWVNNDLADSISNLPGYPDSLYVSLLGGTFTNTRQEPNITTDSFFINNPNQFHLQHGVFDSITGFLILDFSHTIFRDTVNTQSLIEVFLEDRTQIIELTRPLNIQFPQIIAGNQAVISLTGSQADSIRNMPNRIRELNISIPSDLFKDVSQRPNQGTQWHPVWDKNSLILIHSEFHAQSRKLRLEFNGRLNKASMTTTQDIVILDNGGSNSVTLSPPYTDLSPNEMDREIWIELSIEDANIIDGWTNRFAGLKTNFPADFIATNDLLNNLSETNFHVHYNENDPGFNFWEGFHLTEAAVDDQDKIFSMRFSSPVELDSTDLSGEIVLYTPSIPESTINIVTPFSIRTQSSGQVIQFQLSIANFNEIMGLRQDSNQVFLNLASDIFKKQGESTKNPAIQNQMVNFGYTIWDIFVPPPIHGLNFFYLAEFDVLRVESEKVFDDDKLKLNNTISLKILGSGGVEFSLPIPWEEFSDRNDKDLIIPLPQDLADSLKRNYGPQRKILIAVESNTFVHLNETLGNPVITFSDSAEVVFFNGNKNNNPYEIDDSEGFVNTQILKIFRFPPEVNEIRTALNFDSTNSVWAPRSDTVTIDLGPTQGFKVFHIQFKDSLNNIGEWMEDSVYLDFTAPTLTYTLDSIISKKDSIWKINGETGDGESGPYGIKIQLIRDSDGFQFIKDQWKSDSGRGTLNLPQVWVVDIETEILDPGFYTVNIWGLDSARNETEKQSRRFFAVSSKASFSLANTNNINLTQQLWKEDEGSSFSLTFALESSSDSAWMEINTSPDLFSLNKSVKNSDSIRFDFNVNPLQIHVGNISDTLIFINKSAIKISIAILYSIEEVNDLPKVIVENHELSGGALFVRLGVEDEDGNIQETTILSELKSSSGETISPKDSTQNILIYYPLLDDSYVFQTSGIDKFIGAQLDPTTIAFKIENISKKTYAAQSWHHMSVMTNTYSITNFSTGSLVAHWDGTATTDKIYNQYLTNEKITDLKIGKSYWLYPENEVMLTLDKNNLFMDSLNISLTKGTSGWNQISNPYPYDILIENNDVALFQWVPLNSDLVNVGKTLPASTSVWAFSDKDLNFWIKPTPHFESKGGGVLKRSSSKSDYDFATRLTLTNNVFQDQFNYIGLVNGNSEIVNIPELPKIGQYVSLYFYKEDKKWTTAYRLPSNSQDEWWDIGITNNQTGNKKFSLVLDETINSSNINPGNYYLISPQGASSMTDSTTVFTKGNETYYSIVKSEDPEFLANYSLNFTLHSVFPNPVRDYANFSFTLPQRWNEIGRRTPLPFIVQINIYNLKGQLLTHTPSQKLFPGKHKIVWNPLKNNSTVRSGVFIYRISAGEINHSGLINIVP